MSKEGTEPKRILVAEDVKSVGAMMATLLANRGYVVETAADGSQCLDKARSFAPALILLDIMMPKVHGMEALRRLKADPQTRGIGVIVCTARQYKSDQDQARELGAYDVLTKPFVKEHFLQVVERFFSGGARPEHASAATTAGEAYVPRVPSGRCFFRLWGTRGSIPVAGHRFVRHGGNTACVELGEGEESVIIDAGTGIRELGRKLVKRGPRRVHILITHTHWDHIQGFPFFTPAYLPGFQIIIYGAAGFKKDLRSIFRGQLDRDYFPVQFEDMRADIQFRSLDSEFLQVGNFKITWEYTHHPAATLGFKFEIGGKKMAYVSDNEFLYGYLGDPHAVTPESDSLIPHRRMLDFLRGVDLLISEAQYTNEEYTTKIGWGHSSLSNACLLARMAKVKRWVVTHYDPAHNDEFLDEKLCLTKEILRGLDHPIEVLHGYDEFMEYF